MPTKVRKPTRADLERQVMELKGQLAFTYAHAHTDIEKAGIDRLTASGCLLRIHALGGREVTRPVVIVDGLSPETIRHLKADLERSFTRATEQKPRGM